MSLGISQTFMLAQSVYSFLEALRHLGILGVISGPEKTSTPGGPQKSWILWRSVKLIPSPRGRWEIDFMHSLCELGKERIMGATAQISTSVLINPQKTRLYQYPEALQDRKVRSWSSGQSRNNYDIRHLDQLFHSQGGSITLSFWSVHSVLSHG